VDLSGLDLDANDQADRCSRGGRREPLAVVCREVLRLRIGCFAVLLAIACGRQPPRQPSDSTAQPSDPTAIDQQSRLDVELTTDLEIPKDVDSIAVTIAGLSTVLYELGPAGLRLPARVASEIILFSSAQTGSPADKTMDVTLTAWKGAAPFTVSRAVAAIPHQSGERLLRISLSWLCAGTARARAPGQVESTCPPGQSCRAGVCQGNDRTAEPLPLWNPPSQPACFDLAKCMASASTLSVDLATCAAPASDATNFAVVKPRNTEGACTASSCVVPLSPDPLEGWQKASGIVSFPAAVCAALASGRATAVTGSSVCPTWSPDQPLCVTTP
jgi:hypothetical protein